MKKLILLQIFPLLQHKQTQKKGEKTSIEIKTQYTHNNLFNRKYFRETPSNSQQIEKTEQMQSTC